jgi:hypothetical protein
MPRVRDFLYRFRPAGAPGAAAEAGVPIDRTAELTAELEPLFASLARTERECANIRDHAKADAAAIRDQQADLARGVISAGEARTAAETSGSGRGRSTGYRKPGGRSDRRRHAGSRCGSATGHVADARVSGGGGRPFRQ